MGGRGRGGSGGRGGTHKSSFEASELWKFPIRHVSLITAQPGERPDLKAFGHCRRPLVLGVSEARSLRGSDVQRLGSSSGRRLSFNMRFKANL